jgi:hypothetical protein
MNSMDSGESSQSRTGDVEKREDFKRERRSAAVHAPPHPLYPIPRYDSLLCLPRTRGTPNGAQGRKEEGWGVFS